MKITNVETITFQYMSQREFDLAGHSHPTTPHPATQSLTQIMTDEGIDGYCFGGAPEINERMIKPTLVGKNQLDREQIWQLFYARAS